MSDEMIRQINEQAMASKRDADAPEPLTRQAAAKIRNISDLPWVDANENWGAEGVVEAKVKLAYDVEHKTNALGRKYRSGGIKNWRADIGKGFAAIWDGLKGKNGWEDPDASYFGKLRWKLFMARYYWFQHNELNGPDGKVSGTTIYGVWIEEAWHAALWSPVVALAVADWLENADPYDDHALRVAKLIMDAQVYGKVEDEE